MAGGLKRLLLGDPLHNEEQQHQRLAKSVALPVFASDALSSVAYATGEIILVLSAAGAGALHLTWPISLAIAVLLVIVSTSYRQTIKAYPGGGGSYIVAKENLGRMAGLVAGAALLVDYVLTVAVSISAGTAAVTSAFPHLLPYRVELTLAFMLVLAIGNLRGVKESGALFSGPAYAFIGLAGLMVVVGLFRYLTVGPDAVRVPPPEAPLVATQSLTLFLVLKAFASGCAAMTGIEAIANGVTAFREPTARNARITLAWMTAILSFLFLGISFLAVHAGVQPSEETVISQISRQLFGTSTLYFAISAATAGILVLAANTSYADFPRLASLMADDDHLPHQLRDRGHRLVFSNGILLLTAAAATLVVVFGGDVSRLIPLYALGVFLCFTLSQLGMIVHWRRFPEPGSGWSIAVNGVGAATTGVVFAVIATTKAADGGWIVLIIVPALVAYFAWVRSAYLRAREDLALSEDDRLNMDAMAYNRMHNHVIVLVRSVDRRLIRALQYARSLKADVTEALYIDVEGDGDELRAEWASGNFGVPLVVVPSPYRALVGPIRDYVRSIERPTPSHVVTVILPEYVPFNAADAVLHDQSSLWIKQMLYAEPGVIVTDVPYQLGQEDPRNYPQGGERSTARAKPVHPAG